MRTLRLLAGAVPIVLSVPAIAGSLSAHLPEPGTPTFTLVGKAYADLGLNDPDFFETKNYVVTQNIAVWSMNLTEILPHSMPPIGQSSISAAMSELSRTPTSSKLPSHPLRASPRNSSATPNKATTVTSPRLSPVGAKHT